MRAKIKAEPHRRECASNLRLFADRLQRLGACVDVGPLHAAASQCITKYRNSDKWGYRVSGLRLELGPQKRTAPPSVEDVTCLLSVLVEGNCEPENLADPFEELAVDFVLKGTAKGGGRTLLSAWHLDRHVGGVASEVHPLYHFQYGGRAMAQGGIDLGGTLLMGAPRLGHPPMEAILSVDFLLANFCGAVWTNLRADGTYRRQVKETLELLWEPHYAAVAAQ